MNGPLYLTVYRRYRELILDGTLPPGTKMPSLRTCARELKLSRTTIESAYLQLAADGYIIAKAQSGYYVTDIGEKRKKEENAPQRETPAYRFDFASSGADRESFRFDLWRRYMKSALRQDSAFSLMENHRENQISDRYFPFMSEKGETFSALLTAL